MNSPKRVIATRDLFPVHVVAMRWQRNRTKQALDPEAKKRGTLVLPATMCKGVRFIISPTLHYHLVIKGMRKM